MTILGIETSCDETSAAIVEGKDTYVSLKSNVVASSLSLHAKTGGVIPEIAAREQVKYMLPVLQESVEKAFGKGDLFINLKKIDAIAVTYGPGLIGSLLVGVETARTLSYVLHKPLIPVNHMIGHIYANLIKIENEEEKELQFPFIALVISGGHTDLLLFKKHGEYALIGGTRDDAAGEAFDKIGRLLGLAYPAGAEIERLAKEGDPKRFRFPRPLIGSGDFEFSFSGLKTAVLREAISLGITSSGRSEFLEGTQKENEKMPTPQDIKDLARGTQDAIIDVVTKKTMAAIEKYDAKAFLLSGGVAANGTLKDKFTEFTSRSSIAFFAPQRNLCTDNAAMVASAAYFNTHEISWKELTADPELYFD